MEPELVVMFHLGAGCVLMDTVAVVSIVAVDTVVGAVDLLVAMLVIRTTECVESAAEVVS